MAVDKIRFTTEQELDIPKVGRLAEDMRHIKLDGYRNARSYTFGNCAKVAIFWDPLMPFWPFMAIEANPAHFKRWDEFIDFIQTIFPGIDMDEPKVRRIDLCVDAGISMRDVRDKLYIRRGRKVEEISNSRDSMVISKRPKRFHIYDRAHHCDAESKEVLTRFEVQCWSPKCPITKLTDISALFDFDPFKYCEFYEIGSGEYQILCRGFRDAIRNFGFHEAVRCEIPPGKFQSAIKNGYFRKLSEPNLSALYFAEIKRFFGKTETEEVEGLDAKEAVLSS